MSNLQPNCCLKCDFQKVDQHAGCKCLIHDTKRRKDNQLQTWKPPAEYPSWVARCDIKGSDSTMLIRYSERRSRDKNILGGEGL